MDSLFAFFFFFFLWQRDKNRAQLLEFLNSTLWCHCRQQWWWCSERSAELRKPQPSRTTTMKSFLRKNYEYDLHWHTRAAHGMMEWRSCISFSEERCVQTTSFIFTMALPRWPILQLSLIAYCDMRSVYVEQCHPKMLSVINYIRWRPVTASDRLLNFVCGHPFKSVLHRLSILTL